MIKRRRFLEAGAIAGAFAVLPWRRAFAWPIAGSEDAARLVVIGVAANTDALARRANLAPLRIQLGEKLTRGLGSARSPDVGRRAAQENVRRLRERLVGADVVCVVAGMGGGTGTGGAPVIAAVARELGAFTASVVTTPFRFESRRRAKQSADGLLALRANVDALIAISNQQLLSVAGRNCSILETFRRADDALVHAVRGISDLLTVHGLINVDLLDVRAVMSGTDARMGTAVETPSRV